LVCGLVGHFGSCWFGMKCGGSALNFAHMYGIKPESDGWGEARAIAKAMQEADAEASGGGKKKK